MKLLSMDLIIRAFKKVFFYSYNLSNRGEIWPVPYILLIQSIKNTLPPIKLDDAYYYADENGLKVNSTEDIRKLAFHSPNFSNRSRSTQIVTQMRAYSPFIHGSGIENQSTIAKYQRSAEYQHDYIPTLPRNHKKGRVSTAHASYNHPAMSDISSTGVTKKSYTENRVWRLHGGHLHTLIILSIITFFTGLYEPYVATVFSQSLVIFVTTDQHIIWRKRVEIGLLFGIGAIFFFVALVVRGWAIGKSSAALTAKLRKMLYKSILDQNFNFFRLRESHPAVLADLLQTKVLHVTALTIQKLVLILLISSAISGGITLAFLASWQIALVAVPFFPVIAMSTWIHAYLPSMVGKEAAKANLLTIKLVNEYRAVFHNVFSGGRRDFG